MKSILEAHATGKLNSISDYFKSDFLEDKAQQSISLLNGRASTVLLQSMLFLAWGDVRLKLQAEENLEFIVNKIENGNGFLPTHCNGISGLGWLFLFLNEVKVLHLDVDTFLEDLDQILEIELKKMLRSNEFDLLHGAMGIAVYFLRRNRLDLVSDVVYKLRENAQIFEDETKWIRYDRYILFEDIYDFGLAHGNAGILYFLTKCLKNNVVPEVCKHLIRGSLNFFKNNVQDPAIAGSFFPSSVKVSEYIFKSPANTRSRLAWCYGDLGILYTSLSAATALHDNEMISFTSDLLAKSALRREKSDTGLSDGGFCHGTSGVGYMFLNLFKSTGRPIFKETADFWLQETLNMADENVKNRHGYLFNMGESGLQSVAGLLTGVGGLALFLLSAIKDDIPSSWDECFFLS